MRPADSPAADTYPAAVRPSAELTVAAIVDLTGAQLVRQDLRERRIRNIAALDDAGAADICFIDAPAHRNALTASRAGACFVLPRLVSSAPPGLAALVTDQPYRAFATVARALFAETLRPSSLFEGDGRAASAQVHATARIEAGAAIDPLAVIGPRAEIGTGTVIGAGAAIGPDVRIGRQCAVGPGATILHALIGDRVTIHSGVRIGEAGFGLPSDADRHLKIPQTRRVIIQDGVEIGANSTIDRGCIRDTVTGEGTAIGSLVRIGHDVSLGRHCLIAPQAGLDGGVTAGDFVIIGAQACIAAGVTIGEGAVIAGQNRVEADVAGRAGGRSAAAKSAAGQSAAGKSATGKSAAGKSNEDRP
jgi:UDP-3-O-[3-hydroxymyristoyl] glucosamine N-acyltransferase